MILTNDWYLAQTNRVKQRNAGICDCYLRRSGVWWIYKDIFKSLKLIIMKLHHTAANLKAWISLPPIIDLKKKDKVKLVVLSVVIEEYRSIRISVAFLEIEYEKI